MKYMTVVRFYCCLLVLLFLSCSWLYAQNGQISFSKIASVGPVKPTAATDLSTGTELDGVDYFIGALNVSIPIFEVKSKNMSFPITIGYSATGIKPADPGSWTGLGWNINIGGEIIREVRGLPGVYPGVKVDYGQFVTGDEDVMRTMQRVIDGKSDSEPDVFHFSYPGGGGKYTKNDAGEDLFFPYEPLMKIQNGPGTGQTIIDAKGVNYEYEEQGSANSYRWKYYDKRKFYGRDSLFFVDSVDAEGQYSWPAYRLKKMIYPNTKDTILFKFNDVIWNRWTPYYPSFSETVSLEENCYFTGSSFNCYPNYESKEPNLTKSSPGIVTGQKYISEIVFPGGIIKFGVNPSVGLLDSVTIFSSDNSRYLRKARFYYDTLRTFKDVYYRHTIDRYKLTRLSFYDGNDSLINTYSFTYYEDVPFPNSLDCKGIDLWGYYNGSVDNNTLLAAPVLGSTYINMGSFKIKRKENVAYYHVGDQWTAGSVSIARRDPSIYSAVSGTLKTVTSATGGTYEYIYSLHQYWYRRNYNESAYLRNASGLRLDNINYYDAGKSLVKRRTFEYGYGVESDRIAEVPLTVLYQNYVYGMGSSIQQSLTQPLLLSDPLNDLNVYHGSSVGYKKVTEYKVDSNNINNGKTEYYFKTDTRMPGRIMGTSYVRAIDADNMIGLLERKAVYSREGGGYFRLMSDEKNVYTTFWSPKSRTYQKMALGIIRAGRFDPSGTESRFCYDTKIFNQNTNSWNWGTTCVGTDGPVFTTTTYAYMVPEDPNEKWFYGKYDLQDITLTPTVYKLTQKKESGFKNGDSVTHIFNYRYDNNAHLLITSIAENVSDSVLNGPASPGYLKNIKYPQDKGSITNPPLSAADTTAINQLIQLHILDVPIEQETYLNNSFLHKERTDFKVWSGPMILPVRQNVKMGTNAMEPVASVQQYDINGNILEQSKQNDMPLSYLWDYKGLYPIAEVMNASNNDIAYTSFEAEGSGNWVIPSSLRDLVNSVTGTRSFNMSNAGATGIAKSGLLVGTTYKVSYFIKSSIPLTVSGTMGNVVKGITNAAGWTYYEHKVGNVNTVKVTGTGLVDELRLHPLFSQMTTSTYMPLLGVTSQCDSRNQIVYYEYDSFGRLKVIRDQDNRVLKLYDYKYQVPVNR